MKTLILPLLCAATLTAYAIDPPTVGSLTATTATATPVAPKEPRKTKKAMEFRAGNWAMNFSGNINAHYVYTSVDDSPATVEGNALLSSGKKGVHSVQNGLLPTALGFSASSVTADSIELGVVITSFAGTVSNQALAFSGIDLRQAYMTIGKKRMGTFLLGRNFGIFGFDAIINDMSLVGVGATALVRTPLNTSLGGIGYGYLYCDRLSQINYTTPSLGGVTLTLGVYNSLQLGSLGGKSDVTANASESPGFHGKLAFTRSKVALSASFISQQVKTAVSDYTASGLDLFGKLSLGNLGLAGYYYTGKGIGTTALFFDAADATGKARNSSGYYVQGTCKFGKTKIGLNYGASNLDRTTTDTQTLLRQQTRFTIGVYHTLTPGLTLLAENTSMQATNNQSGKIKNNSLNVGAFLAF